RRGWHRTPDQGRVAERHDSPSNRDRRFGGPGGSPRARDRIGPSRPDPHRSTDRRHGPRAEMVADTRALNHWRKWGYRLLPGDLFSYVLHMRPAEWPIMAAHTALGYALAVGLKGAGSGERFLPALLALLVWVIFLNGGPLPINSV